MQEESNEPILFYEPEFYAFSNFSAFKLLWKGDEYMTSEHAYHSEKFEDERIKQEIRDTRSAHDAYYKSREHKDQYRKDWQDVKFGIMKEILHAKVQQHPYVKKKLLDSGEREIIENSWRDAEWGWGPNKDGKNMLGKLWMEVRAEILASESK